jgi:hypothetical protein
MADGLQLPARSVVSVLARIFGPSVYDVPRWGGGVLGRRGLLDLVSGPHPEPWLASGHGVPWLAVMLNPQPLPPREFYALTLADAHIQELFTLDRMGTMLGGEVTERTLDRAARLAAEIDELCPRRPPWPRGWPSPPPPPEWGEEMTATELVLFGARCLAASELMEQERLQAALTGLGEKALGLSMRG